MVRTSLPPGFRFYPTNEELIMYYLKRKALGKKLHFDVIADINVYKYSPWDLPDKSCLKSKDLQWYFFCPREKKYASGTRINRATEKGYWKTTGKERSISYKEKVVGSVKTLVFHSGHPSKGERTNWIIHEYSIKDDQLAAAAVQNTYVLCKVFEKSGPGPKNGAQYGGPVDEAEWSDDDVDDAPSHPMLMASDVSPPTLLEKGKYPPGTHHFTGSTSGSHLIGSAPLPAGHSSSLVLVDENDELGRILAVIAEEDTSPLNNNRISQDDLSGKGKTIVPSPDGDDIYSDLSPLDNWAPMGEGRIDFSAVHGDQSYIELDDLLPPLNSVAEVGGSSLATEIIGSSNYESMNPQHLGCFMGLNQGSCENLMPEKSYYADLFSDVVPMSDQQFWSNAAYDDLDLAHELELLLENGTIVTQDMEIGAQKKIRNARIMKAITSAQSCYFSPTAACCVRGVSSMHIKAEVTHRSGECTNDALLFMVGGPCSSCWFLVLLPLPLAVVGLEVIVVCLLYLVDNDDYYYFGRFSTLLLVIDTLFIVYSLTSKNI